MIWKIKNKALPLGEKTYVMGILNVTPDSFSDGGKYFDVDSAVRQALRLENEGVDILDIGGQSTRPGHTPVSSQEEWERIKPVLLELKGKTALPISIDTYYPTVAARALELGAHIINDVSGVITKDMADIIKSSGAGWVIMHNGVIPQGESASEVVADWIRTAIKTAESFGVKSDQLCVDPGIGFGKDTEQNFELIRNTVSIKCERIAYLCAASRKRCIGSVVGDAIESRDFGTVAAHTAAIIGGADIIRVHSGALAVSAARTIDAIMRGKQK